MHIQRITGVLSAPGISLLQNFSTAAFHKPCKVPGQTESCAMPFCIPFCSCLFPKKRGFASFLIIRFQSDHIRR